MIRECTNDDMQMISEYLGNEVYGRAILSAVKAYGFEERFQTVYVDVEGGSCEGVYLWLHGNLFLYSQKNKVEIDFLEQMFGIEARDLVAGRKDNVNIASWLLTDYFRKDDVQKPVVRDRAGEVVEGIETAGDDGEVWCVLSREALEDGKEVE